MIVADDNRPLRTTEKKKLSNHYFDFKYIVLLGVRSGVLNNGKSQSFSLLRIAVAILFIQ